jgi:hypothetical protein
MAIDWNATRVALEAALPSASGPDRQVGEGLLATLKGAGQTYDAFPPPLPASGTNPAYLNALQATVNFYKEIDQATVAAEAAAGMPFAPPTEQPVLSTNELQVNQYVAAVRNRLARVRGKATLPAAQKSLLARYDSLRPPSMPAKEMPGSQTNPRTTSGKIYTKTYGQIETELVTIIDEINGWMSIKGVAP